MDFKVSLSNQKLSLNDKARVIFEFQSQNLVHCLKYKFTCYQDDKVIKSFYPHEFVVDINGKFKKEFNDVNILETYFSNSKTVGKYSIAVEIEYLVCGEKNLSSVISIVNFEIV